MVLIAVIIDNSPKLEGGARDRMDHRSVWFDKLFRAATIIYYYQLIGQPKGN